MCGYDQTFAYLRCEATYSGCVITSDAPSTVHLTLGGSSSVTNCAKIGGPISLSFEGSQPMSLGSANASTGFLSLTNEADITLLPGFGWGGNSLSVTDGSTLTIAGSTTFPRELALAVSDRVASQGVAAKSSSLVLNANLTVDTLTVNGVVMSGGRTYGSSSSAAAVKDDMHFAGTGVLRVRHPCGMRVEIR